MKKFDRFKSEFEKLNQKEATLNAELQELENKLAEKSRLIYELRIQREVEEDRAVEIDKELEPLQKAEAQLKEQIESVNERLFALSAGKNRRLATLREEAQADVLKQAQKLEAEFNAKMHDLKQTRGVIVEILLEMHKTQMKEWSLLGEFKNLSGKIDDKHEKLRSSIPSLSVTGLKNNYAGDHTAYISPDSEIQWAINGTVPSWFDYWKLTGEILGPSEIAAKEVKK